MELKVEKLMAVKKYHFYIKSGDRNTFLLKASSALVYGKEQSILCRFEKSGCGFRSTTGCLLQNH